MIGRPVSVFAAAEPAALWPIGTAIPARFSPAPGLLAASPPPAAPTRPGGAALGVRPANGPARAPSSAVGSGGGALGEPARLLTSAAILACNDGGSGTRDVPGAPPALAPMGPDAVLSPCRLVRSEDDGPAGGGGGPAREPCASSTTDVEAADVSGGGTGAPEPAGELAVDALGDALAGLGADASADGGLALIA